MTRYRLGVFSALLIFAGGIAAPLWAEPTAASDAVRVLLTAEQQAHLSSPLSGRVARIGIEAGSPFKQGDVLVEFDCALLQQEMSKANSRLGMAESTLRSNLRLKELKSVGDLELAISRGQRDEARAEANLVAIQIQHCSLRAPWDGRVVARHVNPLENVAQGQPLLDINSLGTPLIQMYVPSTWMAWLRVGSEFDVRIAETGKNYRARIARLGAQVDAVSQTLEVFAEFVGKTEQLLPGMSGSALLSPPSP